MAGKNEEEIGAGEVGEQILRKITKILESGAGMTDELRSKVVLNYAEAYAWVTSPNQPHGGK